jgi:hypothetical protein
MASNPAYRMTNKIADDQAHRPPVVTPGEVAGVRFYLDPQPQIEPSDFETKSFLESLLPKLKDALASRGMVSGDRVGAIVVRVQIANLMGPDQVIVSAWAQLGSATANTSWHYAFPGGRANNPDAVAQIAEGLVSVLFTEPKIRDVLAAYKQAPGAAPVDKPAAAALYKEANDLRDAGKSDAALPKYKAAFELGHTPVLGKALAKAYEATGQLLEARDVALAVKTIPEQPSESSLTVTARRDAAALAEAIARRIPRLSLELRGGAPPAVVLLDDRPLPSDAFSHALYSDTNLQCSGPRCSLLVNPGKHVIVTQDANANRHRAEFTIREAEGKTVALP